MDSDKDHSTSPDPRPGPSRSAPPPTTNAQPNSTSRTSRNSGVDSTANNAHVQPHSSTSSNKPKISSKPVAKKLKLDDEPKPSSSVKKDEPRTANLVTSSTEGSASSNTDPGPVEIPLVAEVAGMEVNMDSSEEYEDSGNESSGEDVEFAMDREERGSNERNPEEEYPFTVLSTKDIVEHMVDSIREANTVLQLPPTTMRILLNHFGWDREKLLEAYYDGDQDKLFKEARIVNPTKTRPTVIMPPNSFEECEICCLSKRSEMMYGMECGHRFCKQCWSEYLTTKIIEEGMGQTIACAAHNCPILVDDKTVTDLITEPKVKLKYQHLITNSFVQCNRLMRWCPSADCTNAVRVQWVDWRPVTCTCTFTFCFQCGHAWHDPVKCQLLKKWLKKCDDDSETSNWIAANTKECPKCGATIEKDGGCNHMVCKNQNCKADFCWVCLGPWDPHGSSWYNCNRFDEADARTARDAQERSRSALQRYLFYCNRYMNHMQSLKFESKLYASVKDKMEEMQQHNMSWIEVQFLKKAVDILCQCRQTLMYTYVFAFYLGKTHQAAIFEDNQRDLESATEKLSEYLERDITSENLADIKQKVQDKYRYCESRRQVLLEHVYEGYDKDWWSYNENLL